MDRNPYQSPETEQSVAVPVKPIRVEGNSLVVRSGTVLPPFCVKTNKPVEPPDMQQLRLVWCPPIFALLMLLSGLCLVLVYFFVRKRCTIAFGLDPDIRKRYRNWGIFKIIAVIVLFLAIPVSAAFDTEAVSFAAIILFLLAVVSLFFGNAPLAVNNHKKGEFWISGCSKEYLARLQSME
ncbi:hypothetical protein [Lignipirellula cremea]|uniref:Uncharacterized protein n=1 Tax=Lignipirellula cremea TaxID=2528010 RepID=A0A518DP72_9BACT|nr:hypothetical protein [Lignipirellula cremea]QDU93626.1 hypothetical protein Pla8534_14060 [Lignipirellula cremea]